MIFEEKGKLLYRNDGELLQVEARGTNAVRVRATVNPAFTGRSWALHDEDASTGSIEFRTRRPDPAIFCGDCPDHAEGVLTNGRICAVLDDLGTLTFMDTVTGKVILKEKSQCLTDDTIIALQIPPRKFFRSASDLSRVEVRFEGVEGEHIFGMGQYQQHELDLKGCELELAQRNSQVSVPFYVSSLGYGFLWNNPGIGRVSFARNNTVWAAEATREVDYLVIAGETPAEILTAYMKLTGLPPMMPEYGLGFWQCKLRYSTQEELLSVARRYKEMGIRPDVIVCDFFHWTREGDWKFDPDFWPDPEGMVRELKDMGIRLMVSVWPSVSQKSENYAEMKEKGYLARTIRGSRHHMDMEDPVTFFDATSDEARAYVWSKVKENYWDKGARLYWLDVAEPEYFPYDFDNYRYSLGGDLEVGNAYPKLYLKGFYDGETAEGETQPLSLIRSAWAGSAAYGALVWSGDIFSSFESFDRQLKSGLNMGMAGIPWWTMDIGGFHGGNGKYPLFRELFARWFAWGCFCPVMRLHGDRQDGHDIPGSLFRSGGDNEIWSFGPEVEAICRKYIALRESLRPYIRECMRRTHETGEPVMRPMFYDFPQDEKCWGLDDQYMFGPEYLVAPILKAGVTERSVYLPEGRWQNPESGEILDGGQTVTAPAPLDVIPVFKRL